MKRRMLATVIAVVGLSVSALASEDATRLTNLDAIAALAVPAGASAPQASGKTEPAQKSETPPAAPARKIAAPVRGVADIGHLKPQTKVAGNEVVTIIKVKNMSTGSIVGLRVDEFWWDAQGNPLPGGFSLLKKPLQPGEVADLEIHAQKNPKMNRNSYQFRHANGIVRTKLVPKF